MLYRTKMLLGRFIDGVGLLVALCVLALLLNIFYNVMVRYFFIELDMGVGMQELEWHLFSCLFLFGIGYTLKDNSHVRVDVFYENFSQNTQALINIAGTLVFLIPFCALVAYYGIDFTMESYDINEQSGDPGGLPYRWLIKATIPLSFSFTLVCGVYVILEHIETLLSPPDVDKAQ